MISGGVHRSPGIYLTAEETPKNSARRTSIKAVQTVIASNETPSLQMRSVGSHSMSEREKEDEKERMR